MEFCYSNNFVELDEFILCEIDGGTFWGKVGAVASVVGGVAAIAGGVGLLLVPEPTTLTKYGGVAAITGGVAAIGGGIASFAMN